FITTHPLPSCTWFDKWISVADTPDLKIGETYTFSFYAKASNDDYPVNLEMYPSAGWEFYADGEAGCYSKDIKLNSKWQRYSFTFVANMKQQALNTGYSAIFNFLNSPVGTVWYDAVQIEKGETLTPYKNPSPMNVGIMLNSSSWSNIFFPQDPVTATIRVDMPSDKAELQCQVVDYQGQVVKDFKQAVNGAGEIKLPLDPQRLGWFKVTATLSTNGKIMSTHSANYIKIAKPVDVVSGIQPFAGLINARGIDCFDISRKIGVKRVEIVANMKTSYIGGVETAQGKFDWSAVEWQLKRGKEFGMLNKVVSNPFDVPDWYFDKEEVDNAKKKNSLLVLGSDKHEVWRKFIGELTRRYGDMIDEFELGAEDNGRLGINEYYKALYPKEVKDGVLCGGKPFDDLCAMVKIGAAEIRKTHPDMKIGAIRPSVIGGAHSIFIREMFKKIGKDTNIFPADFYLFPFEFGPLIQQRRGKSDELIGFYNEARKITQELGCNQPIYISEFGWFPDMRFPDDSIYRQEQAETMAKDFIVARIAGYFAFDWFGGFGGPSNVGKYTSSMQQNMKMQSIAASYSAVAQVVENVTESKWLTPDRATRIAIMSKNDGKGVAAVWSDKGYKLTLPPNSGVTVTDLMGNTLQSPDGQFPLNQAPIYIWHKDFKELSEILAKTEVDMTEFCVIGFRMISENLGRLQFANLSNAGGLEIDAVITVNGKEIRKTIDVPKSSTNTCDIPLSGKTVQVKAKKSGSKSLMERSFDLDVLTPITAGSKAAELIAKAELRCDVYPLDPWVPWSGPDDLSVQIMSSWDADNLYLNAKVKDDKHFNKFLDSPWNGDSIQFAIDPKNDGAFYTPGADKKSLGPDDFEFGLALNDDGKIRCVSSHGKDICGSNNYTVTRDEKDKATAYELRLPWKDLGVKPFSGMVLGMSFVIFDDDTGSGQNYYIAIGGGIAKIKNPALYKKFVLK
ncbi:MAG: hypothetical protein NT118_14850, partial [Lentisphaerae bacterium]|nr:hypothetical protein [Lentisphaerota bacterium]